jgi:hypothetical protein
VQCSTDGGKTFGSEMKPLAQPAMAGIIDPSGALSFDFPRRQGVLALTWNDVFDNSVHVATTSIDDTLGADHPLSFTLSSTGDGTLKFPPIPQENGLPGNWQVTGAANADVRFDDAGNLWLAYETLDSQDLKAIAVDKSCDQGKTWSGGVFANAYNGGVKPAIFPGLVPVSCPTSNPACGQGMAVSALAGDNTGAEFFFRLLP